MAVCPLCCRCLVWLFICSSLYLLLCLYISLSIYISLTPEAIDQKLLKRIVNTASERHREIKGKYILTRNTLVNIKLYGAASYCPQVMYQVLRTIFVNLKILLNVTWRRNTPGVQCLVQKGTTLTGDAAPGSRRPRQGQAGGVGGTGHRVKTVLDFQGSSLV